MKHDATHRGAPSRFRELAYSVRLRHHPHPQGETNTDRARAIEKRRPHLHAQEGLSGKVCEIGRILWRIKRSLVADHGKVGLHLTLQSQSPRLALPQSAKRIVVRTNMSFARLYGIHYCWNLKQINQWASPQINLRRGIKLINMCGHMNQTIEF